MINTALSISQLFTTILLYHNQAHCHLHSLQISHVECNDDDDDHVHVYIWYELSPGKLLSHNLWLLVQ